jgi:predicted aspartyl protease
MGEKVSYTTPDDEEMDKMMYEAEVYQRKQEAEKTKETKVVSTNSPSEAEILNMTATIKNLNALIEPLKGSIEQTEPRMDSLVLQVSQQSALLHQSITRYLTYRIQK